MVQGIQGAQVAGWSQGRLQGGCTASAPRSTSSRNLIATEISAVVGHAWNQSMAVQAVSAGNMRQRTRKASPTGDMHSTTCRLERTWGDNQGAWADMHGHHV
jgi:hypothetical protein